MQKPHSNPIPKKPAWLKTRLTAAKAYGSIRERLRPGALHTICESGACPNKAECWGAGTATFMILGDICTRSCRFCNVKTGKPLLPDPAEPEKLAQAVRSMDLKHCVLTSVDRDDLPDGGAAHWAACIGAVKKLNHDTTMEVLIPDFKGAHASLDKIIAAGPEVISHNLETVERLSKTVRVYADYKRSLSVLEYLHTHGALKTKSGIMLGLGETEEEVLQTMDDLLSVHCGVLTIGQYLQPTRKHLPVQSYPSPDVFARYGRIAWEKGFSQVESAPLVRSSYHAEKHV